MPQDKSYDILDPNAESDDELDPNAESSNPEESVSQSDNEEQDAQDPDSKPLSLFERKKLQIEKKKLALEYFLNLIAKLIEGDQLSGDSSFDEFSEVLKIQLR